MESKGWTNFAIKTNFPKTDQHIPKLLRKDWSRGWMLKSFINKFKIIKQTDLGQDKINENIFS